MHLADLTIRDFLNELAAATASPGGGATAGLSGAQGAALVAMVCRLTIGRARYADVSAEMTAILQQAEALRARLTDLTDRDATAYDQVSAAYKLPKDSEEQKASRVAAIQNGLKHATNVPLETLIACVEVLELCPTVIAKGNVNAASDGAAGALSAHAGMMIAAANVRINLNAIQDTAFVDDATRQMQALVQRGRNAFEQSWATALERLGPMS